MKKLIKQQFYVKSFRGDCHLIRFSDLPKDLKDTDIINIHRENESYDAFTELEILREREETDEEYQKRIDLDNWHKEQLKKRRYETYLALKKEFEDNL